MTASLASVLCELSGVCPRTNESYSWMNPSKPSSGMTQSKVLIVLCVDICYEPFTHCFDPCSGIGVLRALILRSKTGFDEKEGEVDDDVKYRLLFLTLFLLLCVCVFCFILSLTTLGTCSEDVAFPSLHGACL
jgi:hypothetical protein